MEVGVGLPNGIPLISRDVLVEWSRRAEELGFATLGAIDRFRYGSIEPIVALTAAAAVTERIALAPTVLMAPLREPLCLSEQLHSLERLAGGRVTLGVGLGGRQEDYEGSEFSWRERGARLDRILEWLGQQDFMAGLPRVIGGHSEAAFMRAARFGAGYISSGGPVDLVAQQFRKAEAAWRKAGRADVPLRWATIYFALRSDADRGRAFLSNYYASAGRFRERVVAHLITTGGGLHDVLGGYQEAGCDLAMFLPTVGDPDQVSALRELLDAAPNDR